MEEFTTKLSGNIYGLIGILTGIIGIGLAIYFYFKTKKVKRPTYTMTSFPLLNSEIRKIDNLEVKYFGEPVQNLTATKFAFWNAGNDTINKSDIPESAPLRFKAEEGITIYSVEVVFCSDLSNNIIPKVRKGTYSFDFDYLDRDQGCIVKILHSGVSSSNIVVSGKVKGVGDFKNANLIMTRTPILLTLFLILGFFIMLLTVFSDYDFSTRLFSFVVLIGIGANLYMKIKGIRIPKDLAKKFNE